MLLEILMFLVCCTFAGEVAGFGMRQKHYLVWGLSALVFAVAIVCAVSLLDSIAQRAGLI